MIWSLLFIRWLVDCLQVRCKRLAALVRDVFQRVTNLMDDAALVLGIRESSTDGLLDAGQAGTSIILP